MAAHTVDTGRLGSMSPLLRDQALMGGWRHAANPQGSCGGASLEWSAAAGSRAQWDSLLTSQPRGSRPCGAAAVSKGLSVAEVAPGWGAVDFPVTPTEFRNTIGRGPQV